MIEPTTIVMYEKAEEIQTYFGYSHNRLTITIEFYQNPEDETKVVWLPEPKHFESMIPHKNLLELDDKFDDFKSMFYENHWFDKDYEDLEGRGADPFWYFRTYNELWLGFVMMDRYRKRWDRKEWVGTDIYPDYFKTDKETAQRDGYPNPDNLYYISGLRGYIEK